jgi:hypothetical protein
MLLVALLAAEEAIPPRLRATPRSVGDALGDVRAAVAAHGLSWPIPEHPAEVDGCVYTLPSNDSIIVSVDVMVTVVNVFPAGVHPPVEEGRGVIYVRTGVGTEYLEVALLGPPLVEDDAQEVDVAVPDLWFPLIGDGAEIDREPLGLEVFEHGASTTPYAEAGGFGSGVKPLSR